MNEFEKKLQDEVDRYKHELFSEQDLNEQLLEKNKQLKKLLNMYQMTSRNYRDVYLEELNTNVDLKIKATAEEPTWIYDEGNNQALCCPCCKQLIGNVWNNKRYMPNYCHFCGKKLKWSNFK